MILLWHTGIIIHCLDYISVYYTVKLHNVMQMRLFVLCGKLALECVNFTTPLIRTENHLYLDID